MPQDATPRVTRATHTGGLDVGEHADAAARFAAAQRALELRDEEDKRAAVERRRAVKQERKVGGEGVGGDYVGRNIRGGMKGERGESGWVFLNQNIHVLSCITHAHTHTHTPIATQYHAPIITAQTQGSIGWRRGPCCDDRGPCQRERRV